MTSMTHAYTGESTSGSIRKPAVARAAASQPTCRVGVFDRWMATNIKNRAHLSCRRPAQVAQPFQGCLCGPAGLKRACATVTTQVNSGVGVIGGHSPPACGAGGPHAVRPRFVVSKGFGPPVSQSQIHDSRTLCRRINAQRRRVTAHRRRIRRPSRPVPSAPSTVRARVSFPASCSRRSPRTAPRGGSTHFRSA
jgi:hypothetical protein